MEIVARKFVCPCCGFPELDAPPYARIGLPPWIDHGKPPYNQRYGEPSYDVCSCCGFEFGNDDDPGTAPPKTFKEYLINWITEGCVWFDSQRRPLDWNLEEQLRKAGIPYQNERDLAG
jgi:hypothetical protein